MNWLKKVTSFSLALAVAGCGVKGDPLPPEKPTELGRGRPTYRRASEEIVIEKNKRRARPTQPDEEEDDSDEKE